MGEARRRCCFISGHRAVLVLIEPFIQSGTYVGGAMLYATARDWARFGLICK